MKPIHWVSAALTFLTILAGYQQYTNTTYAIAQELPARLKSETNVVAAQVDDFVVSLVNNQSVNTPQIAKSNIDYSLAVFDQQSLKPVLTSLTNPMYIQSPQWFREVFTSNSLNHSHVFYIDNVKKAVLTTEISAAQVIDHAWRNFCILGVVYVLMLGALIFMLNRQDVRHQVMAQRLLGGIVSMAGGDFNSIRQMRKDELFRGLVDEFNQLVVQLAHQNRVANKEKQLLSAATLFDELTGFGNKPMFVQSINNKLSSSEPCGYLVLLRLSSLEQINTSLGFDEGDAYISKVSHLLATNCDISQQRKNTYRLSGRDLVSILAPKGNEMIEQWADRLKRSLVEMDNQAYKQGCGLFAIVPFDQSSELDNLLDSLESGLSQAMMHSANGYSILDAIDTSLHGRINWLAVVSNIIKTKGVTLNKQQLKHRFENESLYNFELFTSFEHDGQPYQARDIFAAANRFSMSPELDKVIIEKVLEFSQQATISNARYLIKLSYESILNMDFYYWLKQWLSQEKRLASQLSFEIPELAITQNYVTAKQFISMLHVTHSSVCLDYEGSQYSHQLSRFIGELKIDMIKVNGHYTHRVNSHKERASFVAALVDVAHSINVPVIASQVEHNEEWHQLEALGVDAAQGNLFGHVRPV